MIDSKPSFVIQYRSVVFWFVLFATTLFSLWLTSRVSAQLNGLTSMDNTQHVVYAQVLLPSASGAKMGPETMITSDNIADFTPSPATITKATEFFKAKGFEVGDVVGFSFSLSGPATLFEEVLEIKVVENNVRETRFVLRDGVETTTLDEKVLKHLPEGVAEAVTLPERLDFGPENY